MHLRQTSLRKSSWLEIKKLFPGLRFGYTGMVQYFYSDPDSPLPVRDVCNKQGAGFKTEPHLENQSENYLKACMQTNIQCAIKNGIDYLFLVTMCRNKALPDSFGKQFIVGYLKIEQKLRREVAEKAHSAVRGETKVVSYQDAIPVLDLFDAHFSRPRISSHGKFSPELTQQVLDRLKERPNIIQACIAEIIRLDPHLKTCIGQACEFAKTCLRWQTQKPVH
jgi:hypothetical protein